MTIRFVDLQAETRFLRAQMLRAWEATLDDATFVGGQAVHIFEEHFAQYCGVPYAVGCGNGTDAIELALRALSLPAGTKVITSALTFVATVEAIELAGYTPILVDCDVNTYLLNIDQVLASWDNLVTVVIPVHLFGRPVDLGQLVSEVHRRGGYVIEDACQAHGATVKSMRTGALADIGCFSFFPSKNLGAYGDGGAVVTQNSLWYERIRRLGNHGVNTQKYDHRIVGRNSRLDALQARILTVKLSFLEEWNERRRRYADLYRAGLHHLSDVILPPDDPPHIRSVYHVFPIRVPASLRNALQQFLNNVGIETNIHYPRPIHLLPAFRHLGYAAGSFPVAETVTEQFLSLPMHPFLTETQIEFICENITAFMRRKRP
ncbi:MAG: erythromycin biosynthesis sensory transduction protein eryC1 [Sulfobacillus thermosulfidooxidans]|uniref:Erythromycin biosynthesis sensory transduction protein eryC1 n=1 Tax=Sulfobacillus thermosulfidooxidans TaxID=28034 RepID=A0A2T2WLI9_SULTH|nr:MAG: erythromycin biosynthesis sensory transduction protein eryC1 [Sulfobacillus thermosulfidooxidans]